VTPAVTTSDLRFRYPGAGDPPPPLSGDVLLLTRGGICVRGPWANDGRYLGWCPLPQRDKVKEELL
jgi:hypothetical protein